MPTSKLVLGCDPGAISGLVLVRITIPDPGQPWPDPVVLGALEVGERRPSRCASVGRVMRVIEVLLRGHAPPDSVALEATFFGGNWETLQHTLRGYFYFESACQEMGLPAPSDIVQSEWKKRWLGRGDLDGKDAGHYAIKVAKRIAPGLTWGGDSACALGVAVASTGYIRAPDAPRPVRSKPKRPRVRGHGTAGAPTSLDHVTVVAPGDRARWPRGE